MKSSKTLNFELSAAQKSVLGASKLANGIAAAGSETSYRPWNSSFISCDTPAK